MKLSQWHDGNVKPVHIGVYEVKDGINEYVKWFSFFDGFKFCYRSLSPRKAFIQKDLPTLLLEMPKSWRGIVK